MKELPTFFAVALAASVTAASAQQPKSGGTLRMYHRDNPPTTSIHEEATVSTVNPFMAVFNNLVLFDQAKPRNSLDVIVPDLAKAGPGAPTRRQSLSSCARASNGMTANPSHRRMSAAPSTCSWAKPRKRFASIRGECGIATSKT